MVVNQFNETATEVLASLPDENPWALVTEAENADPADTAAAAVIVTRLEKLETGAAGMALRAAVKHQIERLNAPKPAAASAKPEKEKEKEGDDGQDNAEDRLSSQDMWEIIELADEVQSSDPIDRQADMQTALSTIMEQADPDSCTYKAAQRHHERLEQSIKTLCAETRKDVLEFIAPVEAALREPRLTHVHAADEGTSCTRMFLGSFVKEVAAFADAGYPADKPSREWATVTKFQQDRSPLENAREMMIGVLRLTGESPVDRFEKRCRQEAEIQLGRLLAHEFMAKTAPAPIADDEPLPVLQFSERYPAFSGPIPELAAAFA